MASAHGRDEAAAGRCRGPCRAGARPVGALARPAPEAVNAAAAAGVRLFTQALSTSLTRSVSASRCSRSYLECFAIKTSLRVGAAIRAPDLGECRRIPFRAWTTACVFRTSERVPPPRASRPARDVASRLGWSTVWTTDHVLVDHASVDEYGRIYEAILALAWVGARHADLRLGTSVIVVPQRNAVLLAKELATLDGLSGGRLTVGVGIGWNRTEFGEYGPAGAVRRPRRLPRRDDRAVAPPVVRVARAVPRPVPHDRRLRVRAAAGAVAVADPHRRARRAGAAARRPGRRRLSLELDLARGVRRAASGRSGRPPRRPGGRCRRSRRG